ncbi:MAG: carboxypeptidase regulatory-like domain-containing protein [Chloroflexi bacterium]|nr:carboxypeptidase regulatory-like domain-containing protein [Chloroflexota bacterium]
MSRALPLGFLLGLAILRTGAAAASLAGVQGTVSDVESGAPIVGASVTALDLGLSAVTGIDGGFEFQDSSLTGESRSTTILATAPGYGDWTIQDVRLIAGDTLILDIEMGPTPTLIVVPPPRAQAPDWPIDQLAQGVQGGFGSLQADQALPATIRVRVTGYPHCDLSRPYTVETLDFKEYAKHVLPNEWVAGWPWESLRAGGMAVKMYAWSYIAVGGKWSDADVYDSTCDQVYNPAVSYNSTNQAVDFTWNWRLTRNDQLLRTFYRAYLSQCEDAGLLGNCMGQFESRDMAYDLYTWDEILLAFYDNGELSPVWDPPGGYSLRFYGNGYGDIDRVKIPIDPQVPADLGSEDFTIEWWMKALPGENSAGGCTPGGDNWIYGNILFDRGVFGDGDYGDYGISLANGRIAFGAANGAVGETICGAIDLADGLWHHVAVTRDLAGEMRVFVDGQLDSSGTGPVGDISYRDGRTASYVNDPFLVLGAEKHDADNAIYPSFGGWLDEIRLSNSIRYSADFAPPTERFASDSNTVALYHLNEGYGNLIGDSSGHSGGPSDGQRKYGGVSNGPAWTDDTFWYVPPPTPTPTPVPTATPTPTLDPSVTPTATWTPTPLPSNTPTPSQTPTPTATPVPTNTLTPTATTMPSPTNTPVPMDTPTPLPTPTPTVTPTSTPTPVFGDVPPGHWAYDHINALYAAGFVAGCSADPRLYCPDRILNRAESAVFVLRGAYGGTADLPYPPPDTPTFDDVDPAYWGYGWIESMWTDGFTAGCGTDPLIYCPLRDHTRAEGSVFFLIVKNGVGYSPPPPVGIFDDVAPTAWYSGWVEAAYSEGILPACQTAPLSFCPEDELDRAWAAYMMVQAKDIPIP